MNKVIFPVSMALGARVAAILRIGVAHADNVQTFSDGTNNADVQINGTLGADNTDPKAPIPEGSDTWLNVTLDTATIFYNTKTDTKIVSPTYSIKNNSGRPVDVKVNSFKQNDSTPLTSIQSLNVNMTRDKGASDAGTTASTNLISSGTLSNVASGQSLKLANDEGQMTSADAKGAAANTATFKYDGSVTAKLASMIQPNFTMNLLFTPIGF